MTSLALQVVGAWFLLSVLIACVYILVLAALDGHRRGVGRVRRGTTWDCDCLDRCDIEDGLGCAHRGGRR